MRLTSIEFSFDPCNIYRDGHRGVGYPADTRSVGDSHPSCRHKHLIFLIYHWAVRLIFILLDGNWLLVNFCLDSKNVKHLSKVEATPASPLINHLVLVCPAAQLTCSQKSHGTDNHNTVNCQDTTDVSSDDSGDQWIDFYRGKANITVTSANVGKTSSTLLDAMNSSQW